MSRFIKLSVIERVIFLSLIATSALSANASEFSQKEDDISVGQNGERKLSAEPYYVSPSTNFRVVLNENENLDSLYEEIRLFVLSQKSESNPFEAIYDDCEEKIENYNKYQLRFTVYNPERTVIGLNMYRSKSEPQESKSGVLELIVEGTRLAGNSDSFMKVYSEVRNKFSTVKRVENRFNSFMPSSPRASHLDDVEVNKAFRSILNLIEIVDPFTFIEFFPIALNELNSQYKEKF